MKKQELEKMAKAQKIFEKAFGVSSETHTYISEYLKENVIVVENETRKAYYNFSGELLNLINIQAGE